jgi:hypothetical protein
MRSRLPRPYLRAYGPELTVHTRSLHSKCVWPHVLMCAHRPGNKLLFHCKGSFVTFKIANGKKITRGKAEITKNAHFALHIRKNKTIFDLLVSKLTFTIVFKNKLTLIPATILEMYKKNPCKKLSQCNIKVILCKSISHSRTHGYKFISVLKSSKV